MTSDPSLHPAYRLSGMARPVDPRYGTNRVVRILIPVALVVGTAASALDGAAWSVAAAAGFNLALTTFVSWALARELAPDAQRGAFVAVAVAVAAWFVRGRQAILLPAAVLLATRAVNRTTGKAAEPWDGILLLAGFAALTWLESWTVGIVGGTALLLDGLLPPVGDQPRRRGHVLGGVAVLASAALPVSSALPAARLPEQWALPGALVVAAAIVAVLRPEPESVGDVDREPLSRLRVRSAALLGSLGMALAALDPAVGPTRLWTGWAGLVTVVVGAASRARRTRAGATGMLRR